jgi:hypothetical protein
VLGEPVDNADVTKIIDEVVIPAAVHSRAACSPDTDRMSADA